MGEGIFIMSEEEQRSRALAPEELLQRCNEIRKAGGAMPLDELFPGIIGNSKRCLIAKNLNFECRVEYRPITVKRGDIRKWVMILEDPKVYQHLKETLGWEELKVYKELPRNDDNLYPGNKEDGVGLRLPYDLWCSALAFDDHQYDEKFYIKDEYGYYVEGEEGESYVE